MKRSAATGRSAALFIAGLATLSTLSCGGGGGADDEAELAERTDPCKLFTRDELRAHANAPLKAPIELGPPRGVKLFLVIGLDICQAVLPSGRVAVGISRNFPRETFTKFARDPATRTRPVRGIGNQAVSSGNTLVVLDDGIVLAVRVEVAGDERYLLERARRLAVLALPRLDDAGDPAQG